MSIEVLASGSSGNCYILTDREGNQLLLECGIKFDKIMPHIDFERMHSVLVTHHHSDHFLCADKFKELDINVWSPENVEDRNILISNSSWEIMAVRLYHNIECLGYIIRSIKENKRLLFMTDTTIFPTIADKPFDCMMLECNYNYDKVIENAREGKLKNDGYKNHMALEDLVQWLRVRECKPKHLMAIHLSQSGNIDKELVEKELSPFAENFYIAKRGLKVEL